MWNLAFRVVVVQWRQRNVQKSVMHVQSCIFTYWTLFSFFDVLPTDMKMVEPAKHRHQRDGAKYDMHKGKYKETIYRKLLCNVFNVLPHGF